MPGQNPSTELPDRVPPDEQRFYSSSNAFGEFGMRVFEPKVMNSHHWHGHVEANYLTGASMTYDIDGDRIEVPAGQLTIFWAGIPHKVTRITPSGSDPIKLANIYIPVDMFLFFPHIAPLQVAVLGGAVATLPAASCDAAVIRRWHADVETAEAEPIDVMKAELNLLLRRGLLGELGYLREPPAQSGDAPTLSSAHIRHVIAMIRYILDNLASPLTNAEVTSVTGLHQNYALSLFSRIMRLPLKRFIIRVRLLRARALLTESSLAITTVAETAGFSSISQFYQHFRDAYGVSPRALRSSYTRASANRSAASEEQNLFFPNA